MKSVFAFLTTLMAVLALFVPLTLAQEPSPAGGAWPEFNGRDSFLILENGKLLDTEFEDITVEAWIYLRSFPETANEGWVVAAKPGSFELLLVGPMPGQGPFGIAFLIDTAEPADNWSWSGGLTSRIPKGQLNKWYHVSGSHDSRSHFARLTFDGEYLFGNEILGKLENPGSPLYIGGMMDERMIFDRRVEESYFDGFIDEVRISSTARYKSDYKPPRWSFKPDGRTLALWHFDKATGFLADSSGNGNTLTRMGARFPVEPAGRLLVAWGRIKRNY